MTSDAERWERLQELFHLVQAVAVADRQRVLAQTCPDPELRARVFALITAFDQADSAIPPVVPDYSVANAIGPYVLHRCLGSGGMGSVYLVERNAGGVIQRAALKILAPHAGGPSVVERFHREQHILASLDHPFITRMLDAGLAQTGQPYLVMEYVEGQQLDMWCDERRLTVEERLRLFLKVCEAVDYAHRNLVVHLDLKPSNILVTGEGAPKLLDFGTSKLLDIDGRLTTTISATPSYASPEQLRNQGVTTACDIYSLGAILHELLSGKRPAGEASIAAIIERAMYEQEPAGPEHVVTPEAAKCRSLTEGQLRSVLAGDLSTIIRKCLSARPGDRYASVQALAADIERYVGGRPVLARPQTIVYRLKKFVRRNRGRVAVTAAMAVALVASLGYAWWGQEKAVREGRRAIQMQTFLYRLFKIANSNYTGKRATSVREFLELGVKVLPEYLKDAGDLRHAQLGLAESMYWNGDYAEARKVWNRVVESASAAGDAGSEAEARAYLGQVAQREGQQELALSHTAKALELSHRVGVSPRTRVESALYYALVRDSLGRHTEENVRLAEFAVRESRENGLPGHEIGQALYYLGAFHAARGQLDEAARWLEEAEVVARQDPVAVCDQGTALQFMAAVRWQQGRHQEAADLARQVFQIFTRCRGAEDAETLSSGALWAGELARCGQVTEAVSMLEASLPLWRKAMPPGHVFLLEELYFLSFAYTEAGRWRDAEPIAREGLQIAEAQVPSIGKRLARMHFMLGRALAGQTKYREAFAHLQAAEAIFSQHLDIPLARDEAARVRVALDEVRSKLGR